MKILFVCMGNICRSPALEAAMKKILEEEGINDIEVDSCGLSTIFLGHQADRRMRIAARKQGIEITRRARLFEGEDFKKFDMILAVDNPVESALKQLAPNETIRKKIFLATHFSSRYLDEEMEDPYYDGEPGFDRVMEMALDACRGLLKQIKK